MRPPPACRTLAYISFTHVLPRTNRYAGCNDGCVRLIDLNRMALISSTPAAAAPGKDEPPVIHALSSVPSGVLAGDGDGFVKFWGLAEGGLGLRATQQLHQDAVGDIKVSLCVIVLALVVACLCWRQGWLVPRVFVSGVCGGLCGLEQSAAAAPAAAAAATAAAACVTFMQVSAAGCIASCSMDGSGVHLWRLATM